MEFSRSGLRVACSEVFEGIGDTWRHLEMWPDEVGTAQLIHGNDNGMGNGGVLLNE